MKTKDLNEEQLYEYFAEHFRYEVVMLLHATRGIRQKLSIAKGFEYMPVESFAIHLRNLINFLYPYAPHDDDVCAKDFFIREENWEEIRPVLSEVLKIAKKRADKEVGHLTTLRQAGTPESKVWDVDGLTAELMPLIDFFCKSADKVKRDLDVKHLLAYYSQIVAS